MQYIVHSYIPLSAGNNNINKKCYYGHYLDPTNDVVLNKKLFHDKDLLIDLLNIILRLPACYRIAELDVIFVHKIILSK